MFYGIRWLLAGTILLPWGAVPAGPDATPVCDAPEHRQFDFWAGDWDVYDVGSPDSVKARAHVDRILDGCALREVYESKTGLVGQSFSIYDVTRRVWHQSWVTNRGSLLLIEGGMDGSRMILSGIDHESSLLVRGIWRVEGPGVRETAETSSDQGTTWKPLFDLIFLKHPS